MKVVIITTNDWQGIYVDGECIWQHHDIAEYDWVRLHNEYTVPWTEWLLTEAGNWWLGERGRLPYDLSDIPEEYLSGA